MNDTLEELTQADREDANDYRLTGRQDRTRDTLASQAAQPAEADGVEPGLYSRFHKMLLELLAVIHQDGGQKTQAIGLQLSYEQALELSSQRIAATPKTPAADAGEVEAHDARYEFGGVPVPLATPPAPNDEGTDA